MTTPKRPPLPTPKPRNVQPAQSRKQPQNAPDDLGRAAETIFAEGKYGTFRLRNSREVNVAKAKVKHLDAITAFFRTLLDSLDQTQVGTILNIVAEAQMKAQEATAKGGGNPKQVSIDLIVATALGITPGDPNPDMRVVVGKGANIAGILVQLFGASIQHLASFAHIFTSISEEDFGELDLDEGALVMCCVFMANYDFFSQTLPRILQAFLATWAATKRNSQPVALVAEK